MVNKNNKRAARAGTVALAAPLMLLLSSPTAQALMRDDGDDPGTGLSVFETLTVFVVLPLVLFAVITGLVVLADRRSGGRTRT
ncbi:hypothetical protein [Streptomyces sp. YIM 98790]|uniref:hypothetical protein n=1 Tax=Streptomyces sp. YIM 98790 TaxID=2689077 RepID=UPI0028BF2DE1|nr:hypothetical protein [Streptomyces sp. YIM 98790]